MMQLMFLFYYIYVYISKEDLFFKTYSFVFLPPDDYGYYTDDIDGQIALYVLLGIESYMYS